MSIPKLGWNRYEGPLNDNSHADLYASVSGSLFGGKHKTTYKYAFLKALLDNIYNFSPDYSITFSKLAESFASIYWNSISMHHIPVHTDYSHGKRSQVELLVNRYEKARPHMAGVPFASIDRNDQADFCAETNEIFAKYVIGAFYENTRGYVYGFSKKDKILWLNAKSYGFLADNKFILDQVNYYRWLKEVEAILNASGMSIPNLSTVLEEITKRRPQDLDVFREKLSLLGDITSCFYCGRPFSKGFHLDHVVPWSYLRSDDLWNLVNCCPKCNTSKNNRLPNPAFIEKLILRDDKLGIGHPDIKSVYEAAKKNGVRDGWKPKE